MEHKLGRREFISQSAKWGFSFAAAGGLLGDIKGRVNLSAANGAGVDVAVARGTDYGRCANKAVALLGGMGKFVPKGSRVALLPNAQRWHPGTFTKPDIVRAVVEMCLKAGAEEVTCLSWLGMENWEKTGLAAVLKEEGACLKLVASEESDFRAVKVKRGIALDEAMVMKELDNHDVFIDMPVTKDHAGNKFTGTMKNLMGLNFRQNNRAKFHRPDWKTDINAIKHLDQCIADLNTVIKPDLCVVDATEFIITNGPMGPGEIQRPRKVIAGVDRVAVDAYCCTLWGLKPEQIFHIQMAGDHGLGQPDLRKVNIKETSL